MSAHHRDGSMGHVVYLAQKTRQVVLNFYGDRQFLLFKKKCLFSYFIWLHQVFICHVGLSSRREGSVVTAPGLSRLTACEILVPQPGIEPESSALEGRFLTTGPPGVSRQVYISRLSTQNPFLFFHPNRAQIWVGLHPPGRALNASSAVNLCLFLTCPLGKLTFPHKHVMPNSIWHWNSEQRNKTKW